jgi:DNA polymerase
MAGRIYGKPVEEVTKDERFFGKTTILGAGYGMGANKFHLMLKLQGINIDLKEAERIITIYRTSYPRIKTLWAKANEALNAMLFGTGFRLGRPGVLEVVKNGVILPSHLKLTYNNLSAHTEGRPDGSSRTVYTYDSRREKGIHIYGGKVVENAVQAIARCVVAEQMLQISKRYQVVLTVHDAVMCIVKDSEVEEAAKYVERCMRYTPVWAAGLPVDCEVGTGKSYGEC